MSEHVEGPCDEPLRNALHDVLDPDLGISLIDLGLVYRSASMARWRAF